MRPFLLTLCALLPACATENEAGADPVTAPAALAGPAPDCPADAEAGDVETVTLRFDVTPEGKVVNVVVTDATEPCFIDYAIRAAREWRYKPKFVNGKPAARRGVMTNLRFEVGEKEE